jgi:hypothetical protein
MLQSNSFCHFHLISSVSRPQWPLIYDCIYFSFPPPPPWHQHFWEKLFRCPFHSKRAPWNRYPQLFNASYAPGDRTMSIRYQIAACRLQLFYIIICADYDLTMLCVLTMRYLWFSHVLSIFAYNYCNLNKPSFMPFDMNFQGVLQRL